MTMGRGPSAIRPAAGSATARRSWKRSPTSSPNCELTEKEVSGLRPGRAVHEKSTSDGPCHWHGACSVDLLRRRPDCSAASPRREGTGTLVRRGPGDKSGWDLLLRCRVLRYHRSAPVAGT